MCYLTCFADDKFPLAWSRNKSDLIVIMEHKLRRIIDWLEDSGMKVIETKTNLCLFHRGDTTPITINLYGKLIKSNKMMFWELFLTLNTLLIRSIIKSLLTL